MGSLRALVSTSACLALIASTAIEPASGQSIAWQRSAYGAADAVGRSGCDNAPTSTFVSTFVHGVDAAGNLFVASCHSGLIRTAKLAAATGVELWSRIHLPSNLPPSLGTPAEAFGVPFALAVDGAGNVVVTGYTVNALGWHNLRTIKYDGASGNEIWSVSQDASVHSEARAVALDPSGNVVVTGFRGLLGYDSEFFTVKYNGATGAVLWSTTYAAPVFGGSVANAVAVDATAHVIVTGRSSEPGGSDSIRTIKYHATTGAVIWNVAYAPAGGAFANGSAIALDAAGNAVVTGSSRDAVGAENIRTIKYSTVTGAELWNVSYSGAGNFTDAGNAVAVDASGNVAITGSTYLGGSGYDIRTIKYNGATGAVIWNASYTGASGSENKGHAVALDGSGNVVVAGYGADSSGRATILTLKYNGATGAQLWNVTYDGAAQGGDKGYAVALDPFGDVLVTGYSDWSNTTGMRTRSIKYRGTTGTMLWTAADPPMPSAARPAAMVVDPAGNPVVTGYVNQNDFSSPRPEFRTIKYNGTSGAELWNAPFNAPAGGPAKGSAVAVDAAGNVAVTGYSRGDTGFDDRLRTIKYQGATGAVIWSAAYQSTGAGGAAGTAVAMDSAGNVVVTGYSNDSAFSTNIRTIKYNGATGAEVWNVVFNGSGNGSDRANAVAVDSAGNVLVTGSSVDTVGGANMRTIKYSGATGAVLWNVSYNGAANGADAAYAIALDASGHVVVTGHSTESTASSAQSIRTIKYHGGTGAVLWTASYDGTSIYGANSFAVALDGSGNVAVTGQSWDSPGSFNLRTVKFDGATGARLWTASHAGEGFFDYSLGGSPPINSSWDAGRAIAFDPSGHVIVAGYSADGSGGQNARTVKYDGATGAQIWSQPYDGTRRGADEAIALALGPGGSIFIAGISTEIGKPQSWYVQKLVTPPVSPTALDFGGQSMGTTSAALAVIIANTGTGSMVVTAVAATVNFTATHNCTTLAAGTSCTVNVAFMPNAQGAATGTLTITASTGSFTVALSGTGERSLVTHYYRAILNRAPDASGKAFWEGEFARLSALGSNPNESWFLMANYFFNSPEYIAANKTNTAFMIDVYNTFFNRPPDQGGFDFWMSQMTAGLSREGVIFWFMFSPEFRTFTQGIFGSTAARPEVDMVMDFFRGILNRFPDTAAFNAFVGGLRTAQCNSPGAVYTQVNDMSYFFLFGSAEYANRARTNTQFVSDMYNAFLRRGGTATEVAFWINQLNTNAKDRNRVRVDFIASPEFGARVNAAIAAGCVP